MNTTNRDDQDNQLPSLGGEANTTNRENGENLRDYQDNPAPTLQAGCRINCECLAVFGKKFGSCLLYTSDAAAE